jgi:hypothetical protein
MTIRLAIHIINQTQINLHNNKNKMEQFTRHFPKKASTQKNNIQSHQQSAPRSALTFGRLRV